MPRKNRSIRYKLVLVAVLFAAGLWTGQSIAADVWLRAGVDFVTMPDGRQVTIWGFALDTDGDFATVEGPPRVPGPNLIIPPSDSTLTIHLKNELPEPVSVVIPGQLAVMNPVKFTDGRGRDRVRSFTHEAAPNGGEASYEWTNVRPGTFLYYSGSHSSVQVPMGLYGALKKDAAPGQAYSNDGGTTVYNKEILLLLSEVDPNLNDAVEAGTYGTPVYPTTMVGYSPNYFLYNGYADPGDPALAASFPALVAGEKVLVRFINAGLITRVPAILPIYGEVLAKDGNLLPYSKQQYHVTLSAGSTTDVMITPSAGLLAVYDRRGYATEGASGGLSTTVSSPAGGASVQGGGGGGCFIASLFD